MIRKALQLGFCLLVIATLAAPPARAFDFSYTESGVGSSMAQACNNAIEKIKDRCDSYGPITTDPISALPLYGPDGKLIGYVYLCEATTTYCRIFIGPQL